MSETVQPFWECEYATVYQGDSLRILRDLPAGSVDAVVTDPPYSSGGMMRSDRNQKTSDKYVLTGTATQRPEFMGDNRDQRSYALWCALWMGACVRLVKPGGFLMVFSDWRQYPTISDAIQCGGWVWRGAAAWDKTEASRPQKGWFRTGQLEHVLLASNGAMPPEQERVGACLAGVWRGAVNSSEKQHITGKPLGLMDWLLSVLPTGATVLDPFAGSGTTLLAAKQRNMKSVGIELSPVYCSVINTRLEQGVLGLFEENGKTEERKTEAGGGAEGGAL